MITNNDKDLLRHVENYGFITIEQAYKMIYPKMNRGYEYARQRIQRLCKIEKRLKTINDTATKTKIFIDTDSKINKVSMHRIYTMNLYCCLVGMGAKIEEFKLEKEWNNGKVRSDAFCKFLMIDGNNKIRFRILVETNTSNNKLNLSKYDDIKDEILLACNNKLPRIALIDDRDHIDYNTKLYQVVKLNYKISNLSNLVI
jgi:hypothetical protein